MFEFSCPKCRRKYPLSAVPDGTVRPCPGCGQRLRVVPEVGGAGAARVDAALPPPPPPARGRGGPLLAAAGTAAGLLTAAAILLAWTFLGRGPAGTQVAQAEPSLAAVSRPPQPAAGNEASHHADANAHAAGGAATAPERAAPPTPSASTNRPPESAAPPPPLAEKEKAAGDEPKETRPPHREPPAPAPARPTPPVTRAPPPDRAAPAETPHAAPPPVLDPARRAQIINNAAPPADPNLLAEGPEPVVVGYTRNGTDQEDRGSLCVLKTTGLWYRDEATGKVVKYDADSGHVKWVETADKQYRWVFDPDKKLFTGKAKPPEGTDLRPLLPLSAEDEGRYLVFSLERLQQRIDAALDQHDERLLRACRGQAAALAAYSRQGNLNPDLARLCDAVGPYIDAQSQVRDECRQVLTEARRQMDALQRREAAARSRQQARQLLGFAQALFGAVPQTVGYVETSSGDRFNVYNNGDDEAVAAGIGEMMKANIRYAAEQAQIDVAKTAFTRATADQFQALATRYADRRKAGAHALRAVGARDFGLPPTSTLEREEQLGEACRNSKDYQALVLLLEEQRRQDRGSGQRDNPFLVVEACQMKSLVPRPDAKKRAEEVFDLARQCAAAVRLVPPAAAYDWDRAYLLAQAAGLAWTASTLEIGDQSWAGAYSPKARFAVRLLDRMGPLPALDPDGSTRELRAWALLQGGDLNAALEQALEVQELRKQEPLFGFHLAQLYGARNGPGDAKKAMECLEHAVRQADFCGIAAMRKCPDLQAVRTQEKRAFRDLTAFVPAYGAEKLNYNFGKARIGAGLDITNKSAYAWTNVTAKVHVAFVVARRPGGRPILGPNQTLTLPNTWARIGPQETITVKDAFKGMGRSDFRITGVTVECDQSRK